MAVRSCPVGDLIRKLSEQRDSATMSLTQEVNVPRAVVVSFEKQDPEIEDITRS